VALGFGALALWSAWRLARPRTAPARSRSRAIIAEAR
jgi:hypothetical protein